MKIIIPGAGLEQSKYLGWSPCFALQEAQVQFLMTSFQAHALSHTSYGTQRKINKITSVSAELTLHMDCKFQGLPSHTNVGSGAGRKQRQHGAASSFLASENEGVVAKS